MGNLAEGMAHAASDIARGRQERSRLAAQIKNVTRHRRSEVHSLLAGLKASRSRASRGQAAEAKKVTRARHGEVHSLLQGLKMSRARAAHAYRMEAAVAISGRRREVKELLMGFRRERVANRRHRHALAAAQRRAAAAFKLGLTHGVAALCDNLAKEGRERGVAIRKRLAAYERDRHDAVAIWRGGGRPAPKSPAIRKETPAPTSSSVPGREGAIQSADASPRSGKRPFGGFGHKGSNERHGEDQK